MYIIHNISSKVFTTEVDRLKIEYFAHNIVDNFAKRTFKINFKNSISPHKYIVATIRCMKINFIRQKYNLYTTFESYILIFYFNKYTFLKVLIYLMVVHITYRKGNCCQHPRQ